MLAAANRTQKDNSKTSETCRLPTRTQVIRALKSTDHDVLIIGGGATGAGAALDARTRGLTVACLEREDFSSGTSSRSTKLIWGGSRYLVQALIQLFSLDGRLLWAPLSTVKKFRADFRMVLNCHRERRFLLEKQEHLTNWLPIAVPLKSWIQWPPPFGYYPAALGPLGLFPLFFKFYDSLSGFSAPPSHIMNRKRSLRKFPQLSNDEIKYSSIFYEGQHDDARTNLAIAQTAALEGANIMNYCEVSEFLKDDTGKIIGAIVYDRIANASFEVRAKTVLFCGGPFTDELRRMEEGEAGSQTSRAVMGASGIHIVLPQHYAPEGIGLVDMSTSDGRFLFFLPWEGHVLIGTTDHPCEPSMRPEPDEAEIRWLLNEAAKYLNPELCLRRQDVLSAWSGIRPLATDPTSTSGASRDHVISFNKKSGAVFIAGGKWTTYREMAQDAVDRVLEESGLTPSNGCRTLDIHLIGHEGYSSNLPIRLVQDFGIPFSVAKRLSRAYGGRAKDVLEIARNEMGARGAEPIIPGFPIIAAEVVYAARHEWAAHAEDVLARRTRIAFLDKPAAIAALPRVIELMSAELGWDAGEQQTEALMALEFLRHFGGPESAESVRKNSARIATVADITAAFAKADSRGTGVLKDIEVLLVGEFLRYSLSADELHDCMQSSSSRTKDSISLKDLIAWWNSDRLNPGLVSTRSKGASADSMEGSGAVFG